MKNTNTYDHIVDDEEEYYQSKNAKHKQSMTEENRNNPSSLQNYNDKYSFKNHASKFLSPQLLGFMLFSMILIIAFISFVDTTHQPNLIKQQFIPSETQQTHTESPIIQDLKPIQTYVKPKHKKEGLKSKQYVQNIINSIKQRKQANQNSKKIQQNIKQEDNNKIAAIFMNSGSIDTLKKTLKSFETMNTYPISSKTIVIIHDDKQKLKSLIKENSEYTFKFIDKKIGELAALDTVLQSIDPSNDYYFYSQDNVEFTKKGFIEQSLNIFKRKQNVSQVLLKKVEGVNSKITLMDDVLAGFSLKPSLNSLKSYYLTGGLTNFTRNVTYGKSAELADIVISLHYLDHGFCIESLAQNYVQQLPKASVWPKFVINESLLKKSLQQLTEEEKNQVWFHNQTKQAGMAQYNLMKLMKKQFNNAFYLENVPKVSIKQIALADLGLDKNIEVGSKLDYLNIKITDKFQIFREKLEKIYPNHPFFGGMGKKNNQQNLKLQKIKTYTQAQTYLNSNNQKDKKNIYYKLASKLFEDKNKKQLLEAEYIIYNKTQDIDQAKKKLKLCLFVEGFNLFSKSKHKQLLQSLQNQNYSEYKLLIVDDASKDTSRGKLFEQIKKSYPRTYNKLQLSTLNEERLYTSGNLHVRAKKFCGFSDIVVPISPNSQLIGRQALNVINSVFQNYNIWLALFPSLQKSADKSYNISEIEDIENQKGTSYKLRSALKAYRYQLLYQLPIESTIYLQRNGANGFLQPKFQPTNSDIYHLYPYIEMSGTQRVKIADQTISYYEQFPSDLPCGKQYTTYIQSRANLKTPLKRLASLESPVEEVEDYNIPKNYLLHSKETYQQYRNCLKNENAALLTQPKFTAQTPLPETIQYGEVSDFVKKNLAMKIKPGNIPGINSFVPIQQLPFCLLMSVSSQTFESKLEEQIINSIFELHYQNYKIIFLSNIQDTEQLNNRLKEIKKPEDSVYQTIYNKQMGYESMRLITKSLCPQNSVLMFVNSVLVSDSLVNLNKIHQTTKSWLTYSETSNYAFVHSFYSRVYDFLQVADNQKVVNGYLKNNQNMQAISLLQLCYRHRTFINSNQVYKLDEGQSQLNLHSGLLVANKSNNQIYARKAHAYLLTLIQYPGSNLKQMEKQMWDTLNGIGFNAVKQSELLNKHIVQALDYQEAWYLPNEHNVHKREKYEQSKLYDINSNIYDPNDQLSLCFTMSIQTGMLEQQILRSIKSVLRQNYSNYKLVIVDNRQNQTELEQNKPKIKQLYQQSKVQAKIGYIINKNKKSEAYNILNAALNFCEAEDIQIYINGSFELIGRQVFSTLNWAYINNPQNYIVYTNYKLGYNKVGYNFRLFNEHQYSDFEGRKKMDVIPLFNSWRVKLIRTIPLHYFRSSEKQWFHFSSLTALTYSLIESATTIHSDYLPYLAYQQLDIPENNVNQNQKYKQKVTQQQQLKNILRITPLQTQHSLSQNYINDQLNSVFQKQNNIEFTKEIMEL